MGNPLPTSAPNADVGVNIDAGNEAVSRMREPIRSTFIPNVFADMDAFGAICAFDKNAVSEPVLVSSML